MKFTRSRVLVSNDAESMRLGAGEVYENFQKELAAFEAQITALGPAHNLATRVTETAGGANA